MSDSGAYRKEPVQIMHGKILRNVCQCKQCGDIVESTHVHDFVRCRCGAIAVDGGREYLRRLGDPENMEEMSVMEGTDKKAEDLS